MTLRIPKRKITIFTGASGSGKSSIVVEHNLDIIRNADWIISLGPEGGSKGGRVVFAGTPRELLGATHSLTSRYLQDHTLAAA